MRIKEFIKKHDRLKKIIKTVIKITMLPIMIPIGIVMNIRKIIYTPKGRETDSVGVLGRGTSLSEVNRLNFLKDFVIVNTESKDLRVEPIRSFLKGKRIIHFVNIGEGVLSPWHLLKYNVYRYTISRLKPDGSNTRIRWPRKEYNTEWFGFKTDVLPEEILPYLEGACNTGLKAIAYAAVVLKKKNVYVVGIDFYETSYLAGPLLKRPKNFYSEVNKKMLKHTVDLIARCPAVNFHFITTSSFKCSLPNVKIIKI